MALPLNTRARQPVATGAPTGRSQFLTFSLGRETFALEIRHIREILQFEGLTEVPLMPDCIRGVINLRGAVVPVVDLQIRFGKGATEAARRTCIVIVEILEGCGHGIFGLLVDHVSEVLEIAREDIEPAPSLGSDPRRDFIRGVGKAGGAFVILLDLEHLLSADELASLASPQDLFPSKG